MSDPFGSDEYEDYIFGKGIEIEGLTFNRTCWCCPEQYDVCEKDNMVGYVRLRWGGLRASCPDVGGDEVYFHEFEDGFQGIFDNDEQRMFHLVEIAKKINEWREGLQSTLR